MKQLPRVDTGTGCGHGMPRCCPGDVPAARCHCQAAHAGDTAALLRPWQVASPRPGSSLTGERGNPVQGSYEMAPFWWGQLEVCPPAPPKKPTPNHKLQVLPGTEPRGDGDVPGAGKAPSLPTIHLHPPQERGEKRRSRAEIPPPCHHNIETPAPPPAPHDTGRAAGTQKGVSTPSSRAFGGGGTPSMASPAPFLCSGCFFPRRAVLLGLHGHPTLSPENVPPAPMIHHFVAHARRALPFPHSTTEKPAKGETSSRQKAGGAGQGGTRNTRAVNSAPLERGKRNKDLAGITTSIPKHPDAGVVASPTPERFPTDKGRRHSQHPSGGKPSIPRKTRPAFLPSTCHSPSPTAAIGTHP